MVWTIEVVLDEETAHSCIPLPPPSFFNFKHFIGSVVSGNYLEWVSKFKIPGLSPRR